MTRVLVATALLLLIAAPANAYIISNNTVRNYILNGSLEQQGEAIGHIYGVVDFLTGLQCFVGSPQCGCLSSMVQSQPSEFGTAYATLVQQQINTGHGNEPAF